MILLPTLYFLWTPLIAAIAALVIFARRWDPIAVTAAIAVGACGVMIRIVLFAGSVPYLIVLTGITLVALVVLAVTARTSPQAPPLTKPRRRVAITGRPVARGDLYSAGNRVDRSRRET